MMTDCEQVHPSRPSDRVGERLLSVIYKDSGHSAVSAHR
jgi:hypothetical protein